MNNSIDYSKLVGQHDLSLPDWGPYSKKYFGISHVADKAKGFRFDVSVVPGLYRRDVLIPDVLKESGYTPWEVSEDLNYYSYRQQLVPKDQVYTQVSFSRISDNFRLVRCETCNKSAETVSLAFHLLSMLEFPAESPMEAVLPESGFWLDAIDNKRLDFATSRFNDTLVTDAFRRGEVFDSNAVGGRCIDSDFGLECGDSIAFSLSGRRTGYVAFRIQVEKGSMLTLNLKGAFDACVEITGTGNYELVPVYSGDFSGDDLCIVSRGGTKMRFDGIVVCDEQDSGAISFRNSNWNNEPRQSEGPVENSMLACYDDLAHKYLIWWSDPAGIRRKYKVDSIKETLLYNDAVHQHFMRHINSGEGRECCSDITVQPVTLEPGQGAVRYFIVGHGTDKDFSEFFNSADTSQEGLEQIYLNASKSALKPDCLPAGEKFSFSQQLMSAVTLSNVVFPIYAKRSFIRHHTPGRCWNSLYTWDSGFIGLGLLELSTERAIENLNAYMTEPDDQETAFIHHGSPVPVQHYLYMELWNRTHDRKLLEYFYPRLKQYYNFLAGHHPGSYTRELKSGLLKTWRYFYNSGGWDDYPPQLELHHALQAERESFTPVVTSSQVIRIGKILRFAAETLGLDDDAASYTGDINELTSALEKYSWDSEAGYYSYVEHDASGNPVGPMRFQDGTNYNMGLDGMTPLVAGVCDEERQQLMFERLADSERYMTRAGLSTVDMTAPYYRRDGYWNGAVWMPHQWFFWKAALNEGRGDLAWKIADKALNLWENEVSDSRYCFEHFTIESGRGCGWHHFGGLSTPVMAWFNAYYHPGRLTCGYDVWVESEKRTENGYEFELKINKSTSTATTLLLVAGPGNYRTEYCGKPAKCLERQPGTLEITLPGNVSGKLSVFR